MAEVLCRLDRDSVKIKTTTKETKMRQLANSKLQFANFKLLTHRYFERTNNTDSSELTDCLTKTDSL